MSEDKIMQQWLEHAREERSPPAATDRLMSAIEEQAPVQLRSSATPVLAFVERRPFCKCLVCALSILVGTFPFWYLAYLAKLIGV